MLFLFSAPTTAQERVALVIGNASYENGPDLRNPVSDANAVAAEFSRLGFKVYHALNLTYSEMSRMFLAFSEKIAQADLVVVYFAGHGVQVDGVTYLMPTDAVMRTKEDLITSITLNEVLDILRSDLRASVVLVDACRDNPIYQSSLTRSFTGESGDQTRQYFDLPYGMLIGYASRLGAVAYDGPDKHSPYARALLGHLGTQSLDVELMLRKVRNQVVQGTIGAQVPWTQLSLLGEIVLARAEPEKNAPVSASGKSDESEKPNATQSTDPTTSSLIAKLCNALDPPLPSQCAES